MIDPFTKTRYRVAQHWRFRTETPEARDALIITAVEDHPTQGIVCAVEIEYDPPFQSSPNSFVGAGSYWFTQAALDESVTELVAEKGPGDGRRERATEMPNDSGEMGAPERFQPGRTSLIEPAHLQNRGRRDFLVYPR